MNAVINTKDLLQTGPCLLGCAYSVSAAASSRPHPVALGLCHSFENIRTFTHQAFTPLELLLTQRFFERAWERLIKGIDDDLLTKDGTHCNSWLGNYSFEFCSLHVSQASKSSSEK